MKIAFFKKEKRFKKSKEDLSADINFYWKLVVCFMMGASFLSFAFGYYLFQQISKEPTTPATSDSPQVKTVKKERLEKVLEYFSAREIKSNEILNSPAPFIDPSL